MAASLDRPFILSRLIDLGARVGQKDCFDHTPLFYASGNGSTTAITSLLKRKPMLNDGSLHEAARELHSEAVKMLVAAGHGVNFPSLKHEGRTPLGELCYRCSGTENLIGLHETISELEVAKADPLKKCGGRTALFLALSNPNPIAVVEKLIEVSLWKVLNDPSNVFEQNDYTYSATMYIKKGLSRQPEMVTNEILKLLQHLDVEDRYYAKERMQQPKDAVGMPQRIADSDHKKWIRSNRIEDEHEDHKWRLRRTMEEMSQTDQLNTRRHLLAMEQVEDMSRQAIDHKFDAHLQSSQFRSLDHAQSMKYKDQRMIQQLDETAASTRLKSGFDDSNRSTLLQFEGQFGHQKLSILNQEQDVRLGGAQSQQQLKLKGMSAEGAIKDERAIKDLQFRAANDALEEGELNMKLNHAQSMNADRVFTQDRIEDIARNSQQRKNELDQNGKMAQLEFQQSSDNAKLEFQQSSDNVRVRTEGAMNEHRQINNNNMIKTRSALSQIDRATTRDKYEWTETDRQRQIHFNATSDRQRLNTLQRQGQIQNNNLFEKAHIENTAAREKNSIVQDNRNGELQHTQSMGYQRVQNEEVLGRKRIENEYGMGQQRIHNETGMGQAKASSERMIGQQRIQNENGMGQAKVRNELAMSNVKVRTQQQMANINRAKLIDGVHAQQAGAMINNGRHADDLRFGHLKRLGG
jgi:hypothetical protein